MALKAMVATAAAAASGIVPGTLLGVNDDIQALPPLVKANDGTVISEWVSVAPQGPDKSWDRATKAFVSVPPAPTPVPPVQQVSASVTFAVATGQIVKTAAIPIPVDASRATVAPNGPYNARLVDGSTVEFTTFGISLGVGTFTVWATVSSNT